MEFSENFKQAVNEKNKLVIVTILQGNLLVDKTFKYFDEMCKYAENEVKDLYDNHNGEIFLEESDWNKSYMDRQMTILIRNFSKERIEFLKKMITKLYPPKEKADTENFEEHTEPKKLRVNKNVGLPIGIIGAVTTTLGVCLSMKPVWIVGIAIMGISAGWFLRDASEKNKE